MSNQTNFLPVTLTAEEIELLRTRSSADILDVKDANVYQSLSSTPVIFLEIHSLYPESQTQSQTHVFALSIPVAHRVAHLINSKIQDHLGSYEP